LLLALAEEVLAVRSPAGAVGVALQRVAEAAAVEVLPGPRAVAVQYGLPGVGAAVARYA